MIYISKYNNDYINSDTLPIKSANIFKRCLLKPLLWYRHFETTMPIWLHIPLRLIKHYILLHIIFFISAFVMLIPGEIDHRLSPNGGGSPLFLMFYVPYMLCWVGVDAAVFYHWFIADVKAALNNDSSYLDPYHNEGADANSYVRTFVSYTKHYDLGKVKQIEDSAKSNPLKSHELTVRLVSKQVWQLAVTPNVVIGFNQRGDILFVIPVTSKHINEFLNEFDIHSITYKYWFSNLQFKRYRLSIPPIPTEIEFDK